MKIWVDDIRIPPDVWWDDADQNVYWRTNSRESIRFLEFIKESGGIVNLLSLDHDLGGGDTSRPIVIWMIENDFWPVEIRIHTANPVGREWLEGMIERYKP